MSTGVIAGSGGTGLIGGHSPDGTGVLGGSGIPEPEHLGSFVEPSSPYSTTWATPSITAEVQETQYLVFVQSTCGIDQPAVVSACAGMGLNWTRLILNYYDSSTSGADRSSMALFVGRGVASDGPLTFTKDTFAKLAVSVIAVQAPVSIVNFSDSAVAGSTDLVVGPFTSPPPSTVLIAANCRFDDSQREPALEGDWTELGWSGFTPLFNAAVKTAYVSNDVDTTFNIDTDAGNQGGIMVGVVGAVPTYAANVNALSPSARYPLVSKSTAPGIDDYDTEISKTGYELTARYPLETKSTSPGGLVAYDTLIDDDMDPGFYVKPAALGTGSDPEAYDTLIDDDTDPGFSVLPGPLGTGSDPENYGTYVTTNLTPLRRRFPLAEIDGATPFPPYSEVLDGLSLTRHFPLAQFADLESVILANSPVSYWRLNDNTAGVVTDQGSLGNDASTVGGVTWSDEPGPDGQLYPTFNGSTGYLSAPDQNEYSINTVDGSTFVITFKPTAWTGTPLLLGKFIVSNNEWEIQFSSSGDGEGLLAQVFNTGQAFPFLAAEIDGPSASLDDWHTLIVVFPPGDTTPVLYLNSDEAQTVTASGSGSREPDSTGPLTIGGSASAAGFFTGSIGHVAVFDEELAGPAITDIMDAATNEGWTVNVLPRTLRNLNPGGYWKLDDATATAVDSSGNDRNGTASSATDALGRSGPDGLRYRIFESNDDCDYRGLVTIPHNTDFDPDGHGLTVVALVYSNAASLMYPVAKRPPVNQTDETGWQIGHSATDWRSSILDDEGVTFRESEDDDSVEAGQWQLVIVRQGDQAAAANEIELFIDSATVTSTQLTGDSGTYATNPNAPLYLGGFPWSECYGLDGAMAHVAIYPRELTNAEIEEIYDAALADGWITLPSLEDTVLDTSPVSYWKLDDATTTAVDLGSLGNDGTYGSNVTLQGTPGPDGNDYPNFNGANTVNDFLTMPHNAAYLSETGPGLTVMCLVKSDDVTSVVRRNFILKNGSWWLRRFNAQPLFGNALANNNTGRQRTGNSALTESDWALIIATTVDNTTFPDLFVDGSELGGSDTGSASGSTGQTGDLIIGGDAGGYSNLDGSIAHVAIWSRVLTAQEIDDIEAAAQREGWLL